MRCGLFFFLYRIAGMFPQRTCGQLNVISIIDIFKVPMLLCQVTSLKTCAVRGHRLVAF